MYLSSSQTIRIHNVDPAKTQVSLDLALFAPKASPRLRRGVTSQNVVIGPGKYIDVCKRFNVSIEEARRIIARSPQVRAHHKRLLIREFPPVQAQIVAEVLTEERRRDAAVKTAELNPPDPVNAVPVGVNLEDAGLPADTPRMRYTPTFLLTTPKPQPPEEEEILRDLAAEAAVPPEAAPLSLRKLTVKEARKEPTMDWSVEELLAFAAEREINIGQSQSKTMILRKIRKALTP